MFRWVSGHVRAAAVIAAAFLLFAAIFLLLPDAPRAHAGRDDGDPSSRKSGREELPNYDIRTDKSAYEKVAAYRTSANRSASMVADERERAVRAARELKSKVPTLKVEYSPEMHTPEVIAPDVSAGRAFLTSGSKRNRSETLSEFLRANNDLVGATDRQVRDLRLFAEYTNPDGNLSFVEYNQEIGGIPVFRGEIKAAFTKKGEIIRVVNNFAPGLDYEGLSRDFGDPVSALQAAAQHINYQLDESEARRDQSRSEANKAVFGSGEWSPIAEKIYFPTEPGVAVPAWRVLIWAPLRAYYVIVDAATGTMLWRKCITDDQAEHVTLQVYRNPNAMLDVARSPAPVPPTIVDPNLGTQGLLLSRSDITRIGNEGPYGFNSSGWIADGTNTTDGNNVQSGLDLSTPDGIDAGTQADGVPYRQFRSDWNPPPGNGFAQPDAPSTTASRRGAVIQQFYIMNWYHDEIYRLGFTEAARNFQQDNFGRGGLGGDRISAEGQDFAGSNNANFGTGADGIRGKMQMFVWNYSSPFRDGTGDADIMIHEVTHGTSNRLHGNAGGLTSNMSRGLGEGWSDFYAHAMLSEPNDPLNGTYSLSGYLLLQGFNVVGTKNYYYGIRRFPKAIMSSTGGPNNRPHNPLTFADIDQTQINLTDGAFPAMSGPHISTNAEQTHAAGEIWSSALWEVRGKMIQRLGWEVGNRKVLQLVTDGMKLSPLNPTFLQARDAIIAAAFGSATTSAQLEDAADVWAGFAIRGMGVSASIQNVGDGSGTARVTEAFDLPNLLQLPAFTVSDVGGGDGDGIIEPGETVTISVPLTNVSGLSANNVTAQLVGGSASNYGNIANSSSATRQFTYAIPTATACGASLELSLNISSSLGPKTVTLPMLIGNLDLTYQENFDSVATPLLPAGWTADPVSGGINFISSANKADTFPNSMFAQSPSTIGGGTNLTSPPIQISSAAARLTFRHSFDTEAGWDGGALEISIGNGAYQDILAAGGQFVTNGYNGPLGPGTNNPLAGRQTWSGNSGGFVTTTVQLPPSASGNFIRLRWRFGADDNTPFLGWNVDTVKVFALSTCSYVPVVTKSRADWDGDGRTDLTVFRPSNGNWYLKHSSNGNIGVVTWGVSTDSPAPGDFDGDGRLDLTIFRPTAGDGPDFYLIQSNGFLLNNLSWGEPGDKPVIGDYDGDGRDDLTVYRPSNNTWYIRKSTGGIESHVFGQAGDVPVPGKYDGDNKTDRALFRNGAWIIQNSTGGTTVYNWGEPTDVLVPADYDGDDRDDVAVWRPSNGIWYVRRSTNGQFDLTGWGVAGDVPVPGDYDGDGRDDLAIYRSGVWYLRMSSWGFAHFDWGVPGDIPIPAKYIP
jgi:hypothetical protein